MAIVPIAEGESGASARAKLNQAFTDLAAEASSRLAGDAAEASARALGDAAEAASRVAGDAAEATARLRYPTPHQVQHRPGDARLLYTTTLDAAALAEAPLLPEAMLRTAEFGRVARLTGSGLIAMRALVAVEPSRVYRARAVVQRRYETDDPSNDAIRFGVAWYDQLGTRLSSSVLADLLDPSVGGGRVEVSVGIGRTAQSGVTVIAPAAACYMRPFVQAFGAVANTDVEVITVVDVTDSALIPLDAAAVVARVAALESLSPGARLDALESAVSAPARLTLSTQAAISSKTVGPTVQVLETLGEVAPADGGGTAYVRDAAGAYVTADGAHWRRLYPGELALATTASLASVATAPSVSVVRTSGYAALADGGGATWRLATTQSAGPGRRADAAGRWFELDLSRGFDIRWIGGVGGAAIETATVLAEAIIVAAGRPWLIPPQVVTLRVPEDYATIQTAIDATRFWDAATGATSEVKILVAGHRPTVTKLADVRGATRLPVTITGPDPVPLVVEEMQDGALGPDGTLRIKLSAATIGSVAVGDVVIMRDFAQSSPTSGGLPYGSAPVAGALNLGYTLGDASVDCRLTMAAGSTSATFSKSLTETEAPVGAVIYSHGQARIITARPTPTTATVSAAWTQGFSGDPYFYLLMPEAGTVTITAGNLVGTDTTFLSRLSPGDGLIVCDDDLVFFLASVSSDTAAALATTITFSGAKKICVVHRWWEVTGGFDVRSVNTTTRVVALKTTSRHDWKPPYRGLIPRECVALKASVTASAGGVSMYGGRVTIDNIALRGWGAAGNGVEINAFAGGNGFIRLGSRCVTLGFLNNVFLRGAVSIDVSSTLLCGPSANCISAYTGPSINGDSLVMHGAGNNGIVGDTTSIYLSRMIAAGCKIGVRGETGFHGWVDWGTIGSCGERGMVLIGPAGPHFVGLEVYMCKATGIDLQNGPALRGSGILSMLNRGLGLNMSGGARSEDSYLTIVGNYLGGVELKDGSNIAADQAGIVGNFGPAAKVAGSRFAFQKGIITKNSGGVTANPQGVADLSYSYVAGNGADLNAYADSSVYVLGILGSPVCNPTLNTSGNARSRIFNDAFPA